MRCELIAELATNHGGDLALAGDMIRAAADAGADWVKTQAYQVAHLRPSDPQYDWLKKAELSVDAHVRLRTLAETCGVRYLTTVYCWDDFVHLREALDAFKVGSGEAPTGLGGQISRAQPSRVFVSLAWGKLPEDQRRIAGATLLATVPIYPMPPECYSRVTRLNGWSDHAVGADVAKVAIAQGVRVVEKHFSLPRRGRNQGWDMTPADLMDLRRWAEACAAVLDGTRYEGRWTS